MKNIILVSYLVLGLYTGLSLSACTSSYAVKNRALVLSAEKLDNELLASAKEHFVDVTQQKDVADFMKKNSRIDITNVEVKGDTATAELAVKSPAKKIYAELATISGKDWQSKVDSAMETKHYQVTLKKSGGSWVIGDQKEILTK